MQGFVGALMEDYRLRLPTLSLFLNVMHRLKLFDN